MPSFGANRKIGDSFTTCSIGERSRRWWGKFVKFACAVMEYLGYG